MRRRSGCEHFIQPRFIDVEPVQSQRDLCRVQAFLSKRLEPPQKMFNVKLREALANDIGATSSRAIDRVGGGCPAERALAAD